MQILIKEFMLIVCGLYAYSRIINIAERKSTRYLVCNIMLSVILTIISYFSEIYFSYNTITIQIVFSFILLTLLTKDTVELSLSAAIISYGISYVLYLLATLITSLLFANAKVDHNINFIYAQYFAIILQLIMIVSLFRLKRLKNGMPFLQKKETYNIILYICLFSLFTYIVFHSNNGEMIYVLPAIMMLFSAVLILAGWRNRITKDYIQKLHTRQVTTMQEEIKVQSDMIVNLENNSEALSRIIHKDNKLIPSMLMAVNQYLQSVDSNSDIEQIKLKGISLMKELNSISQERKGNLNYYEISNRKLISTDVISIDSLMNYMLQKSKEYNINLELSKNINLSLLIDTAIFESDLRTLLADLIENAIIAVSTCSKRNILIDFGNMDGFYLISIYDSGIPFPVKVLNNFGKKRVTTHHETGGSGIGLVSTFELIKKYKASLIIVEYENNEMFTKKLSIYFDNQSLFKIVSPRASVLSSSIKRTDMLITK